MLFAVQCLQLQQAGKSLPKWLLLVDRRNARFSEETKVLLAKVSVRWIMDNIQTDPQPGEPAIRSVKRHHLNGTVSSQSRINQRSDNQHRTRTHTGETRKRYCFNNCSFGGVDDGNMIQCFGCDNWFHFECVGLDQTPNENEEWICPSDKQNWIGIEI